MRVRAWIFGQWQRPLNLSLFVALICLGNLIFYQKPLLTHAISVADLPNALGYLQLISLQLLQLLLLAFFLFLAATISTRLLKAIASIIALTNAAALYFMLAYKMELDGTMIANILNTDTSEAAGLWSAAILPYLFFFGVIPTILIWKTKVTRPRRIWRFAAGVGSLVVLIGWLFATAHTWAWYDQNGTRLGAKILPWSYIVNTARHYNQQALNSREQVLLPLATFDTPDPARKEIVVLVIGESARAENFSAYGYGRDTNQFTQKTSMVALPIGQSCATNTLSSTACILTHEGREASSHTNFEPLPSYMTRNGIETIYRTNNSGPPPVVVTHFDRAAPLAETCQTAPCPDGKFDETLNWGLGDMLAASTSKRIFVTLHQKGSHGPVYADRYPADFETFTPVCDTAQVSKCSQDALVNAYDNSIRYTDFLLADLIAQLSEVPNADSAMIYVSDHGQSLGEGGNYLHGLPISVAPKEQRDVPFLVWMSDGFQQSRGITAADIIPAQTYPHDLPFHSVMGAFGMKSDIYKPEYDIFHLPR